MLIYNYVLTFKYLSTLIYYIFIKYMYNNNIMYNFIKINICLHFFKFFNIKHNKYFIYLFYYLFFNLINSKLYNNIKFINIYFNIYINYYKIHIKYFLINFYYLFKFKYLFIHLNKINLYNCHFYKSLRY
eukprot:GHVU01176963.1.p2 GENE.GHVU01176963.1~~GHVU01176963.1.p2  ORF type:complete len:130 (+),score=9.40 GHVU01176963.1:865-1254(+)